MTTAPAPDETPETATTEAPPAPTLVAEAKASPGTTVVTPDVLVPRDGFHDQREIAAAKATGATVEVVDSAVAPFLTAAGAALDQIDAESAALRQALATLQAANTTTRPAAPKGS